MKFHFWFFIITWPNCVKMETSSMPLATESFSYSWLSSSTCNNKSPANGLDELLVRETSCSSNGGTTTTNKDTTLKEVCQNFNFDISVTNKSLDVLVHADELFSDGLIKPVFVEPSSKVDSCSCYTPDSSNNQITNKHSPLFPSSGVVSPETVETTHQHGFLRRWKTSTRRTLRSLFRYVSQLCKKVGCCSRKYCVRVDDIDNKKEWQVKCWSSSQQASPKSITVHPISAFHDELENSIFEAVLHCKRSIEK